MNFYALALCVLLAVWSIATAAATLLRLAIQRAIDRAMISASARAERSPGAAANVLFAVRTLPLWLAMVLTLGFAMPAFLRLEPHATGEAISLKLWLFAAAGALLLAAMMVRGGRILWATSRAERSWRANSQPRSFKIAGIHVPLYCVDTASPLLAVTGFFRPRIYVARRLLWILTPGELTAALAHEMDHVRRFDNLKQFLLKLARLPRWLSATRDASWTQASEIAADQGALAHGASALDLAAALVKVAALQAPITGDAIAASHLVPDCSGTPFEARVLRLQRIIDNDPACLNQSAPAPWKTILLVALPMIVYAAAISAVLPAIHEALEFLVR